MIERVYQSGNQIVLAPNPHWAGTKPGFKHIVMRFIGDTAALQANLLSGDIDIDNNITLDQETGAAEAASRPVPVSLHAEPDLPAYRRAHVNPILADPRIRRALLMAIDRETLNKRLFDGRQIMARELREPAQPRLRRRPCPWCRSTSRGRRS